MIPTLYALIPMAFALLGGLLTFIYVPRPQIAALLQYFVAGVVISAVVTELLPKILHQRTAWVVPVGYVIGILFMVALHELAHLLAHKNGKEKLPLRLVGASAIDLLIDGVLIGLAFIAGEKSGLLIALSLTPCAFFMTMTVCSIFKKRSLIQLYFILFLALMLPLGAFLGWSFAEQMSGPFLEATIAAAIAALLYLGVEEFLVEAWRKRENHWVPLAFFLGFLIVLMFEI